MTASPDLLTGRAQRVRKNLQKGLALAWSASPSALVRYTILGMVSAAMTPVAVYLGAVLVNRIAEARALSLQWTDLMPIVVGLWLSTGTAVVASAPRVLPW